MLSNVLISLEYVMGVVLRGKIDLIGPDNPGSGIMPDLLFVRLVLS